MITIIGVDIKKIGGGQIQDIVELVHRGLIKNGLDFLVPAELDHLYIVNQKWRLFEVAYMPLGVFLHHRYKLLVLSDLLLQLLDLVSQVDYFIMVLEFHDLYFFLM